MQVIDQYRAGLLPSPNALYKELRRIWGREAFEGTRNCYNNLKARCRDGYATLDDDFDFATFMATLGPRPTPGHSVDRIDNLAGYSVKNIRWATKGEQARNRSSTTMFRVCGKPYTLAEAAELSGVPPRTIRVRRSAGLSDDEAVFGRSGGRDALKKLVFSESAAIKWDFATLEKALFRAKSLGYEEQRIAINELLRRRYFVEGKWQSCYIPDEYDPTPEQIKIMEHWSNWLRRLGSLLERTYPQAHKRFLSTGYVPPLMT